MPWCPKLRSGPRWDSFSALQTDILELTIINVFHRSKTLACNLRLYNAMGHLWCSRHSQWLKASWKQLNPTVSLTQDAILNSSASYLAGQVFLLAVNLGLWAAGNWDVMYIIVSFLLQPSNNPILSPHAKSKSSCPYTDETRTETVSLSLRDVQLFISTLLDPALNELSELTE